MHRHLARLVTAVIGATALALVCPAGPTRGADWTTDQMIPVPFPVGSVSDVEVVSTGPGDAVAAAVIGGAVHAATAVDGVWSASAVVTPDVDATRLLLEASGDQVVVGWVQNILGDDRVVASRRLDPDTWSAAQTLTAAGADVVGRPDIGIAGTGLVVATASAVVLDQGHVRRKLLATEWSKAGSVAAKVLRPDGAERPSLDVNAVGEALIAYVDTSQDEDAVTVLRRTSGQWGTGSSTENTGPVAVAPDVALSDNGQGQVVYSVIGVDQVTSLAYTSRVLPDGTALPDILASGFNESVLDVAVDVNADGSALFAWIARKDGIRLVRYATAKAGSSPNAALKLTDAAPNASGVAARIGDGGLQVVQHMGDGRVVTHAAPPGHAFVPDVSATGFAGEPAADVDAEGHGVIAGFKPGAGVQGRFYDAAGPEVTLGPLPANQLANPTQPGVTFPVGWEMSDTLSDIPSSDVVATTAAWYQAELSDPQVVVDDAAGTAAGVPWKLGTTYCLQVRSTDAAANTTTSAKKCTTVPLDDGAFQGAGWDKVAEAGNFRNTLTSTSTKGQVLTRTGLKAKRLALVVKKTPDSGTVKATFAGQALGSFSLGGTGKKQVVPLATFPVVESGTLTLEVVSADGKPVSIDGLVVAK